LGRAAESIEALAAAHPEVVEYRNDLATLYNSIGAVHLARDRPDDALRAWSRAVEIRARLAADHPSIVEWQDELADSLNNLAVVQRDLGRSEEALRSWGRAAAVRERLVAAHPDVPPYRCGLAEVLGALGGLQGRLGRMEEASRSLARARAMGESLPDPRPIDHYTLAYIYAQCSAMVGLGRAEQAALADRGMSALRRAVEGGFADLSQLERDADLDPLRSRDDFRALLLDLAFPNDPFAR
jgi:tetratricopeptide (TPR) repeat protein